MPIPPKPRIPLVRPEQTTFDTQTVEAFLIAFGDDDHPLPETVKCLDEIVTEYVAHAILSTNQNHKLWGFVAIY